MKVAIAPDDPSVFWNNLTGKLVCGEAIIGEEIAGVHKQGWDFEFRSLSERFDIADTPCQSTHRVAGSATGFEAAMDVGAIHYRESVAVILAQPLFDFWVIKVKVEGFVVDLWFVRR